MELANSIPRMSGCPHSLVEKDRSRHGGSSVGDLVLRMYKGQGSILGTKASCGCDIQRAYIGLRCIAMETSTLCHPDQCSYKRSLGSRDLPTYLRDLNIGSEMQLAGRWWCTYQIVGECLHCLQLQRLYMLRRHQGSLTSQLEPVDKCGFRCQDLHLGWLCDKVTAAAKHRARTRALKDFERFM